MSDLPGLSPNDPHNLLSNSARRRISEAVAQADLLRTRVLEKIETRFYGDMRVSSFSAYCESGQALIEIRQSFLDSARLILSASVKEFRAIGKAGKDLREIMHQEIESLVNSFELTTLQRNLLTQELDLYREAEPEEAIPELSRERIRVGLLSIQAKRLGGKPVSDCMAEAYDVFAAELLGEAREVEEMLMEQIPVFVFRAAVDHKWITYPFVRPLKIVGNMLEGWYTKARHERIPHSELTAKFGGYRVTLNYEKSFKHQLQERVAHWRAAIARQSPGECTPYHGNCRFGPIHAHPSRPVHAPRSVLRSILRKGQDSRCVLGSGRTLPRVEALATETQSHQKRHEAGSSFSRNTHEREATYGVSPY